jgi:hypothetical protein
MSQMEEKNSNRIGSIVEKLCMSEDKDVVLRFDEPISVPDSKYDGVSYETETLPKATLNATISRAIIEDSGETLICSGEVYDDEMARVGIDSSVVWTEGDDDEFFVVEISAGRQWWLDEYDNLTREKADKAIEQNREDEVLPPWDELPKVMVDVERTSKCLQRHYESGYSMRYSPPKHKLGSLIDVRIK